MPHYSERGVPPGSGQNPDQNQGEPGLKPKWIELHREMFPEGSIGFALFPDILEGRKRPETIFNQPLKVGIKTKIPKELQNESFVTISDILYLPHVKLSQFKRPDEIKDYASSLLNNLAITPHAKLLGAIFNESQYRVPPEREQEIIDVVSKALDSLTLREQKVLTLRFGLEDGIVQTQEYVGGVFDVTEERVRQIETKVLRKLRHPSRSKDLKQYRSLPTDSLGREVFGAVFWKDLPILDVPSEELPFSGSVKSELRDLFPDRSNADDLAKIDLEKHPLSPVALAQIKEFLEVTKIVYEEEKLKAPLVPPTEVEIFPANNLLPEIQVPNEQLLLLASQPTKDLELTTRTYNTLKRSAITTISSLLSVSREDLLKVRGLGHKGFFEIAGKLEKVLKLSPKESEGFIVSLFQATLASIEPKYRDLKLVRYIVQRAKQKGATNPEEIQDLLTKQNTFVLDIPSSSWKVKAFIEYVLNHPEEE